MTETIIPGTYIEVRAEGLISAGGIATGVIAVIGTASDGPVLVSTTLAMPDDARATFGPPDDVRNAEDGTHPLTLVRAAELCYANGASTVVAVRVAGPSARSATLALKDANGATVATLAAARPGSWGNGSKYRWPRPRTTALSSTRTSCRRSTNCGIGQSSLRRSPGSG